MMIPEPLGYTWTYTDESGESRTVTTDAAHVLQTEPVEVKNLSAPMTMELQFDEAPESVKLLVWDDTLLGQYQDGTAEIPEGKNVEITENNEEIWNLPPSPARSIWYRGQWEQGTAE